METVSRWFRGSTTPNTSVASPVLDLSAEEKQSHIDGVIQYVKNILIDPQALAQTIHASDLINYNGLAVSNTVMIINQENMHDILVEVSWSYYCEKLNVRSVVQQEYTARQRRYASHFLELGYDSNAILQHLLLSDSLTYCCVFLSAYDGILSAYNVLMDNLGLDPQTDQLMVLENQKKYLVELVYPAVRTFLEQEFLKRSPSVPGLLEQFIQARHTQPDLCKKVIKALMRLQAPEDERYIRQFLLDLERLEATWTSYAAHASRIQHEGFHAFLLTKYNAFQADPLHPECKRFIDFLNASMDAQHPVLTRLAIFCQTHVNDFPEYCMRLMQSYRDDDAITRDLDAYEEYERAYQAARAMIDFLPDDLQNRWNTAVEEQHQQIKTKLSSPAFQPQQYIVELTWFTKIQQSLSAPNMLVDAMMKDDERILIAQSRYEIVLAVLNKRLETQHPLKNSVEAVLAHVTELYTAVANLEDIELCTNLCIVLNNSLHTNNPAECFDTAQKLLNIPKYRKIAKGLMILGVLLLCGAAATLCVLSAGATTPFMAMGFIIGKTMLAAALGASGSTLTTVGATGSVWMQYKRESLMETTLSQMSSLFPPPEVAQINIDELLARCVSDFNSFKDDLARVAEAIETSQFFVNGELDPRCNHVFTNNGWSEDNIAALSLEDQLKYSALIWTISAAQSTQLTSYEKVAADSILERMQQAMLDELDGYRPEDTVTL